MNAKTVKKLRRFAAQSEHSYHGLKKLWLTTPRGLRVEMRNAINKDLNYGDRLSRESMV